VTDKKLVFEIAADEVDVFAQDVASLLQTMEAGILQLEHDGSEETVYEVFRAAHTFKALAGAVGHQPLADLTHALENLFDDMRQGKLEATAGMVDELLATVDVLAALRDEVLTRVPSGLDVEPVIGHLHELSGHGVAKRNTRTERAALPEGSLEEISGLSEGEAILSIELSIDPECQIAAPRLMQGVMILADLGHVLACIPTEDDLLENRQDGYLSAILVTAESSSAVESELLNVPDVAEVKIGPYQPDEEKRDDRPAAGNGAAPAKPATDTTVRISVERLDALMNLMCELITDRTRLDQIEGSLRMRYGGDDTIADMNATTTHIGRVVDLLQDEIMRARLVPLRDTFHKFPRLVRDMARATGKDVALTMEGESTELDRSIIEVIGDPLIHLLRNAVDHGTESPEVRAKAGKPARGTILLSAEHVEGQIVISVADDGSGIDPAKIRAAAVERGMMSAEEAQALSDDEAIRLIFRPSLSTASEVTELSGRGMGMDIVLTTAQHLGGNVIVESVIGQGTTFRVTLPLTLAIVQAVLVSVHATLYAIPLTGIIDSHYVSDADMSTVMDASVMSWRGQVMPLIEMSDAFRVRRSDDAVAASRRAIVTVASGKDRAGLVVDEIVGKQDIVVTSFSRIIGRPPGLSGCTILGDGRIALIVDVVGLLDLQMQNRRQEAK